MTKNSLAITKNGSLVTTVSIPTHYGWGLGFFSDHKSHNCSSIGKFSLNNIRLTTKKAKDFNSIIRQPSWGEETARFIINLEDGLISDFDNPLIAGEILTRLLNEQIHYMQIGTATNKAQAEGVIAKNDGKGLFTYSNNYNTALTQIADYIASIVNKPEVDGNSQYVLVDKEIDYFIDPANLKSNTATPEYPDGRWGLDHNFTYFDNDLGQAPFTQIYQDALPSLLTRPGEYEIFFADKGTTPRFICAHRRPVANQKVNALKDSPEKTALIERLSKIAK